MKKLSSLFIALIAATTSFAQAPTQFLDIDAGTGNSSPTSLFVFNNTLFFSADDSGGTNTGGIDLGREPWISDGTVANTNLLLDINSGTGNSSPFNVFEFNNAIYFTANDGAAELWTTDLTAAGTTKVDLFPAVNGDVPNNAIVFENVVYLTTNQADGNNQLTEWDGTNPAQIAPNAAGASEITTVSEIVGYNNLLYLYMETSVDEPTTGRELYSYNPSTDTYTLIKDIASGNDNAGISDFTIANGLLYFEAQGDLWQTDGTEANTIQVPAANVLGMNGVADLYNFNEDILFEGDNGAGDQLWILDTASGVITQISTNAGTNANHDPTDYVTIGDMVYYRGEDSNDTNGNLFRTDGVTTTQLDDTIIDIDDLVVLDGLIYMEGDNGTDGNELFVFNPATASLDPVNKTTLRMYPNPSNGLLSFSGDLEADASYSVYDLSGRSVLHGKLQNNQLRHALNTGIYFVEIQQAETTQKMKLIVE
jgi:ELWxxDGT repeat protein